MPINSPEAELSQWVITHEDDDLTQLDLIRIGYVQGKPRTILVSDKGHVFEMNETEWEKQRFAHNGRDKYGNKVR